MERLRFFRPLVAVILGLGTLPAQTLPPLIVPKTVVKNESSDAFFATGQIPRLDLTITKEDIDKLTREPRNLVSLTISEPGQPSLIKCSVKLKGSAGSFRQITEDRPGFSLRTAKTKKTQEFHGLTKFMLNNCAQDGSMLHELMAGEMARSVGVPASRCTHAFVSLNGKKLGTYVLKEGFNRDFLTKFFKDTSGHLYDGGFCQEINPNLEVDHGDPDEKVRLTELIGATGEKNPALRQQRMERILDIDAYFRHLALENILCHWDGYSFNRNNYRIYEDPSTGKFYFILHGMDQVFGDARWDVFRDPSSAVSNALWDNRAMRERYRTQFQLVYDKSFRNTDWATRTLEVAAAAKAKLMPIDPEEAKRFDGRGKEAANQIRARMDGLRNRLADIQSIRQAGGKIALGKYTWAWSSDKGQAKETSFEGRDCFVLNAGAEMKVDYRLKLAVSPGRYRFTGQIKTKNIVGPPGDKESGAYLRLSGARGMAGTLGTTPGWIPVSFEFSADENDPVLVIELKATAGQVGFAKDSLTLTRL